jgi:hypothetical protein
MNSYTEVKNEDLWIVLNFLRAMLDGQYDIEYNIRCRLERFIENYC